MFECCLTLGYPLQHKQIDGVVYGVLMVVIPWLLAAVCSLPYTMNGVLFDHPDLEEYIDGWRIRVSPNYINYGLIPSYYAWIPVDIILFIFMFVVMKNQKHHVHTLQQNSYYGTRPTISDDTIDTKENDTKESEISTEQKITECNSIDNDEEKSCGIVPNGVVSNGELPNGEVPNGIVPNGVVPNGVVPNGKIHNGTILNGVVPMCDILTNCMVKEDETGEQLDASSITSDQRKLTNGTATIGSCDSGDSIMPVLTVATVIAEIHEPHEKRKAGKEQLNEPLQLHNIDLADPSQDNYGYVEDNQLADLIQVKKVQPEEAEENKGDTQEKKVESKKSSCKKRGSKPKRSILKRENSAKQSERNVKFAIPICEFQSVSDRPKIRRKLTGRFKNRMSNKNSTIQQHIKENSFEYLTQMDIRTKHQEMRQYRNKYMVWLLTVLLLVNMFTTLPFHSLFVALTECTNCTNVSQTISEALEWLSYASCFLTPLCFWKYQSKIQNRQIQLINTPSPS